MNTYQLIVIGAGPGGYEAALHGAALGMKTAIVESREGGGTCLNRGCIPTKTLLHTAELARQAREGETFGVTAREVSVDFAAMGRRKDEVVEKLRGGIEDLFRREKVDLLRGTGQILAPGQVSVEGTVYTADHSLIATGSVPALPPIPGLEHAVTSDELLDRPRQLDSLVIIGGGVIGMEFASLYHALGCRVTVLEAMDRILPNLDREICQNLTMILKKQGVEIVTSARVTGVERTGEESCTVRYSFKEEERAVEAQLVLCAIGRRPNTQGLFGEGVAPEMERGRILVDESFQTSLPGVYAVGDVSSKIQLAHAATAQGIACVDRLAGRTPEVDAALIPSCIYTSPEIASVGLSADEAKAGGRPVAVGKYVMFSNGKTVIQNSPRGFIKLVAEPETGVLLGAQMMCDRATDMISQLTQAVANRMTVAQLRRVVYPHPTFSEGIGQALEELEKKLTK